MKDLTKGEFDKYNKSLREFTNSDRWTCIQDNCKEPAIKSHLIQKEVHLKSIAENGYLFAYAGTYLKKRYINFKRVGVVEALRYRGFCEKHDDEIFASIEKNSLVASSYVSQILLSYRTTAIERRKKEVKKAHAKFFLNYLGNRRGVLIPDSHEDEIAKKDIEELKLLESEFEKEIDSGDNRFSFFVFSLPFYEICAVSTYNFLQSGLDFQNKIFFHLIPEEGELKCIIGYHKECNESHKQYVQTILEGGEVFKLEMVSDILLTKIENWVVSPEFYAKYIDPKKDEYSKLINAQFSSPDLRSVTKRLKINIFQKSD